MARHTNQLSGSFEERCLAHADKKLEAACKLPVGTLRDDMIRDARQMRVASDLQKWLSSPGLRPPE